MVDGSPVKTVDGLCQGQLLAGKYRIDETLGSGGMGIVVAAYHIDLDERVAIKFLRPEGFGAADVMARFSREARASRRIKSEYVARIYDVGRLDDGTPYMVMEYLEGEDLAQRLCRQGPLPVQHAVSFLLQGCEALADAHALGIVHRDLKPSNLFIIRRTDGSEAIKVLDFGISKVAPSVGSESEMSVTRTATVLGSPLYMSPEQLKSARDADARSDIWALGSTLYELVVGVPPFEGETITELSARVASDPAPNAHELRADIPLRLARLIQRCLEKDRAHRFQNVAELAAALAEFSPEQGRISADRTGRVLGTRTSPRSSEPVVVSTPAPAARTLPSMDSHAAGSWARTSAPTARRQGLVATMALGAVVALGLLAYVLIRSLPTIEAPRNPPSVALPPNAQGLALPSGAVAFPPSDAPRAQEPKTGAHAGLGVAASPPTQPATESAAPVPVVSSEAGQAPALSPDRAQLAMGAPLPNPPAKSASPPTPFRKTPLVQASSGKLGSPQPPSGKTPPPQTPSAASTTPLPPWSKAAGDSSASGSKRPPATARSAESPVHKPQDNPPRGGDIPDYGGRVY